MNPYKKFTKETLFAPQEAFTEKCYCCSFDKAFLSKKRFVLKEKTISTPYLDEDTRSRVLRHLGSNLSHGIPAHAACPAPVGLCEDAVSCR